jgi:hypothetical protein
VRKIYSPTVGVRIFVRVKVSVNECTANLVFNMERVSVGTAWLISRASPKLIHVSDFPTVGTVQHTYSSAAQWLRLPLYTKPCYNDVLILWYQNHGTAARRLVRTERYTNGVWCKAFTVENLCIFFIVLFIFIIMTMYSHYMFMYG